MKRILVLCREAPQFRRVACPALDDLYEPGRVVAPAEGRVHLSAVVERDVVAEGLGRLAPPGSLLRPVAVRHRRFLGLEADEGDAAPVGRDAAGRPEVSGSAWLDLLLPPGDRAPECLSVGSGSLNGLDEHGISPLQGCAEATTRGGRGPEVPCHRCRCPQRGSNAPTLLLAHAAGLGVLQ